jgi:prepilin-type processing-associated H-X9-DG protein
LNRHLADKRIRITSRDFGGLGSGEVVVMGEKTTGSVDYYMENTDFDRGVVEKYRHGVRLGSNYLFMDGHVDILLPRDVIGGVDPWEPPIKDVTSQPVVK